MKSQLETYIDLLISIFKNAKDKHEANAKSSDVLRAMSDDPKVFSQILINHIRSNDSLNNLHYPVLSLSIANNRYFTLVANCWIPLPDKNTQISTKAIHHHGDMLLSTVTAFGSGYEHWMFKTPCVVDKDQELYELELIERAAHPKNHVAFVDAYIAHLPLYPADTTITYALWSSRFPSTWKDSVKRIPLLEKNSTRLREIASKLGMAKQLELKVVEYFDFYPTDAGFKGIKNREEFELSENADYLKSLFHIIQTTGNSEIAVDQMNRKLESDEMVIDRPLVSKLLGKLKNGDVINGKLSASHYNVPKANFSADDIKRALSL